MLGGVCANYLIGCKGVSILSCPVLSRSLFQIPKFHPCWLPCHKHQTCFSAKAIGDAFYLGSLTEAITVHSSKPPSLARSLAD